ncbi:MAG: hypothetical protein CSA19_02320, partial [Deltaproteobacteria bacterium]
ETDYSISDFCADLRAPTPSAAMTLALPDANEMRMSLDVQKNNLQSFFEMHYASKTQRLNALSKLVAMRSPKAKILHLVQQLTQSKTLLDTRFFSLMKLKALKVQPLKSRLDLGFKMRLKSSQNAVESLGQKLFLLDPKRQVKDNFAQVVKNQKPIKLDKISIGEEFLLIDKDTKIKARALEKNTLDPRI